MPSVNPIQAPEPRVQPMNKQQTPSGDPFAEMLDSAANRRPAREDERADRSARREQPTAPASRGKTRADALTRGDQPKGEISEKPRAKSEAAEEATTTETTAAEETAAPNEAPETDADGQAGDGAAETPDVPAATQAETAAETSAVVDEPAIETGEPDLAEALTPKPTAVADGDAAVPEAVEVAKTPMPATEAAPNVANVDEGLEEAPVVAAPKAAAAPQTAADDGAAEAPKATPAIANNMRAAAPATGLEQAQQPAPAPASQNTASFSDAIDAISGDSDQQPAQQQNASPQTQTKPQETAARPAESAPSPASVDPAAPKAQLNPAQSTPMPEPVRALNASFESAMLNPSGKNEWKPVPLNASAIAIEIVSRLREGTRRFDIRLDPPELGRIDVRLEVDRSGNVSTKLTVDRPETLDLVQREARGLERALQQAGLKTDAGGLEFSLRQHADERFAQGQGNSGRGDFQSERAAPDSAEPIEAAAQGYYRAAAFARGGVDITI